MTAGRWMLAGAVASALVASSWRGSTASSAAPHMNVRGASLGLFATDPDYDYRGMLDEIARRGASDVLIVYRLMQSDVGAHDLRLAPGLSPSEATLTRTVAQARARGLRVGLMPIVGLERREPGQWRGTIAPRAGADVWFDHYREHVLLAARLASDHGAARLIVGSELNRLEHRQDRWRSLIRDVRAVYRGPLLYSANWDRYESLAFWDALDAIAVSAYFQVERARARHAWRGQLARLEAFARAQRRPLLLSEVGYPAHGDAARFPWDETRAAPLDLALQAELLGAFCDAYEERPGAGYYVWNWFGWGGPRDRGYALRGKPAAAVFERCMSESERNRR